MVGEAAGKRGVGGGGEADYPLSRSPIPPFLRFSEPPAYIAPLRTLPLALVALTLACGPGAVNPASILQPDVKLHHLAVRNLGLSGGTLDVGLAFHNPNKLVLKGVGLSAGLDIEGTRFGDVLLDNPFTLAANDTTVLTVPLTFRWSGVGSAARALLDYGAVNYTIAGKFTVNTPVGASFEVPFTGQGNVPLLKP